MGMICFVSKDDLFKMIDNLVYFNRNLEPIKDAPLGYMSLFTTNYSKEYGLVVKMKAIEQAIIEFTEEFAFKCVPTFGEYMGDIMEYLFTKGETPYKYEFCDIKEFELWLDVYKYLKEPKQTKELTIGCP